MWGNREAITCFGCNKVVPGDENKWIETRPCHEDGFQGYTCYGCLKHYCYNTGAKSMELQNPEDNSLLQLHTRLLRRLFGDDCLPFLWARISCDDCYELECHQCNEKFCSDCLEKGDDIYECEHCHKYHCYECDNADFLYLQEHSRCRDGCCDACRIQKFKEGQQDCTECMKQIATYLCGESLARKRLQEENEQLKVEVEELKREVEELKSRNLKCKPASHILR